MTYEQEVEMTRDLFKTDKINRRQLAIRATNAQQNAERWSKKFPDLAAGAYATARAHLFELIERNAARRCH